MLAANGEAVAGAAAAVVTMVVFFARWRPAVVVSLGGYASLPCVVAALVWRVPVVVVSLDAVPGLVNRFASRFAAAFATGVPGPVREGRAHHGQGQSGGGDRGPIYTGVPVRREMAELDRSPRGRLAARQRLGLPAGAKVVVVTGGSLGSLRVNRATARLAEIWAGRGDLAVRHVVGKRDWAEFSQPKALAGGLAYQAVPYEEDMASLYGAADVAVQRAGASTVAELALAGVPSVLVPLPGAPGDHQGANARAMASAGAAVVLDDGELDGERLAKELDELLSDASRLAQMGEAARSLARPDAAKEIAELVERAARLVPETVGVASGRGGQK